MNVSQEPVRWIRAYFKDKSLLRGFLFGSKSSGDGGPDSHFDILVELGYTLHIGLGFVDMKRSLEQLLKRKVDLAPARPSRNTCVPS